MSEWFATPATTPRFTEPETQFVRFVAENYYKAPHRSEIKFLEIGSGSGSDLKFLRRHGFNATGIDPAPEAFCDFNETAEEYLGQPDRPDFDCIYDLNVLCCVKDPPYQAIAEALKPGGKFYSITPAKGTMADFSHLEYVRLSKPTDIHRGLHGIFSKIDIGPYTYWHRKRTHINWIVEADK